MPSASHAAGPGSNLDEDKKPSFSFRALRGSRMRNDCGKIERNRQKVIDKVDCRNHPIESRIIDKSNTGLSGTKRIPGCPGLRVRL